MKRVEDLTVTDLVEHPVWEYVGGEPVVVPVTDLPVDSLLNRIVGTQVHLANGNRVWSTLSNVSLRNPRSASHFLTLSIENKGEWFHLRRYHDVDYDERGPEQLAEFLGLPVTSIFPIRFDISDIVSADPLMVRGYVPLEPPEKLSRDELIQLALQAGVAAAQRAAAQRGRSRAKGSRAKGSEVISANDFRPFADPRPLWRPAKGSEVISAND
jgi:hypothetical protein